MSARTLAIPSSTCSGPSDRAPHAALLGVLVLVCLAGAPRLTAKEKAPTAKMVGGMVMDKDANGVGGAEVTLKDLQTGKTIAVYAEAHGEYQFVDLDPHHDYQIQARFKGMASESRQINSFDTRRKLTINLTLSPPGS